MQGESARGGAARAGRGRTPGDRVFRERPAAPPLPAGPRAVVDGPGQATGASSSPRARSSRAIASDRPVRTIVSKMPGPTFFPVSATRVG